ncbi:GNAT family N-acetyltransferase, partial [Acinetobacter baumannii]|uniref:GNAT family N-acetyltransferase n=1 Tax=Acinetobacter baumannii TaxID=470 RepID=UPI001AECBE5D
MNEFKMIKDIRDEVILRQSFTQLAEKTFGINFEDWYQAGYWEDNYKTYSIVINSEVVANVSVTVSELIIGQKVYKTAQLGTVMTAEKFRGKGLSKKLIEYIIEEYQDEVDFIYLYANEQVLSFYPKFGFKRVDELCIEIDINSVQLIENKMEKIDFAKHQKKIEMLAKQRNIDHLT